MSATENKPVSDAHATAVPVGEAREMWCPEVRNLYADEDGSGAAYNKNKSVNGGRHWSEFATCIGQSCMAWRWVRPGAVVSDDHEGPVLAGEYRLGYCGKAGGR